MQNAILIENLFFSYEEELILEDICLSIESGEFIGIIGPNGGGKTTLLKLLMGIFKPSKGNIQIFGTSPRQARTRIGYVPQIMRFDRQFPISVIELVLSGRLSKASWWGSYSKMDKQKAIHALERVGLAEFKERPFSSLSGGQAQRALIARALATEPDLLLLDEPTASVDIEAETTIHHILKQLSGNITILMVTHDLKAILSQVKRVYCFQKKMSVLTPEQLCEHFSLGLYHPPLPKTARFESGSQQL